MVALIVAVGEGQGRGLFAVGLIVSGIQLAAQVRVSLKADDDPGWPLIGAETPAGRVAAVLPAAAIALFCLDCRVGTRAACRTGTLCA
jgi:hypothetical protein